MFRAGGLLLLLPRFEGHAPRHSHFRPDTSAWHPQCAHVSSSGRSLAGIAGFLSVRTEASVVKGPVNLMNTILDMNEQIS